MGDDGERMSDNLIATLTRLDLKLDLLLSSTSDHEARLRSLESRGLVTARQMWAGLIGCSAVLSAVATSVAMIAR